MVIDNYKPLKVRDDVGRLWENFIVAERRKFLSYTATDARSYFWRTYTGAEIDYVEDGVAGLKGYEIKYNSKSVKPPKTWQTVYSQATYNCINQENFLDFCTGQL